MPDYKKVSQIKSSLLRPATTSHFEVVIPVPQWLRSKLSVNQPKLNLLCSEAVLPGSNLATIDIQNDYTGVTEKHVHRRMYDDRIDLTFYVDAGFYTPIKFFEAWIDKAAGQTDYDDAKSPNYFYRMEYPDDYIEDQGLQVIKFEKDHWHGREGSSGLQYDFIRSFPLAINSMPVSYDGSNLLKCTVSMSYIRYLVKSIPASSGAQSVIGQSQYNMAGFFSNVAGQLVDAVVDKVTGSDLLGDIAGGFAAQQVYQAF